MAPADRWEAMMRWLASAAYMLAVTVAFAQPVRTVLPNGAKLITSPEPGAPWVIAMAFLKAGEDTDQDKPGTRWVTAQAAYRRHALLSPSELQHIAAAVGGGVRLFVERDHLRYEVYTTGKWLENALFLLGGAAKHGELTADEVEAAKNDVKTSLRAQLSPATEAVNRLLPKAFGGHPFGSRPTAEQVDAVTVQDCRDYYARCFRPELLTLVIAGDVLGEDALRIARQTLGGWSASGPTPTLPPAITPPPEPFELVRTASTTSAYLAAGFVGPPPTSKEFPAFAVVASALGKGETSVLSQKLRGSGSAYQVATGLLPTACGSLLFATIQFSPFEVDPTTGRPEVVLSETRDIAKDALTSVAKEVLEEAELAGAKRRLIVDYLLADPPRTMPAPFVQGHQRLRDRAFWLGWWEMVGCGYEMDAAFPQVVERVTAEELLTVARKYCAQPSSVLVVPLEP